MIAANTEKFDVEDPSNYRCFYTDFANYSDQREITTKCADITFYNKGTSIMVVNDIEYSPGTGISIGAKEGEMNVTRLYLRFINTGAQINRCFVVRQIMVKKTQ